MPQDVKTITPEMVLDALQKAVERKGAGYRNPVCSHWGGDKRPICMVGHALDILGVKADDTKATYPGSGESDTYTEYAGFADDRLQTALRQNGWALQDKALDLLSEAQLIADSEVETPDGWNTQTWGEALKAAQRAALDQEKGYSVD